MPGCGEGRAPVVQTFKNFRIRARRECFTSGAAEATAIALASSRPTRRDPTTVET